MAVEGLKILAIDDNGDDLGILKAAVQDALPDATIFAALSGPQGIARARAEDPDVILLDLAMPGMDGYAVCRALKADDRLCAIPVLFLTTPRADRESRVRALEAGAEAFLAKPLDEVELIAQIRAMAKINAANRLPRPERDQLTAQVAERTHALEQELAAHKQIEEALRESEERFRGLYENTTIGIYRTTPDGRILMANPAAVRLLGFGSFEELAQRNLDQDGYEPSYPRDQFRAQIEKTGSVTGLEAAWVKKDGTSIYVRESARIIRDKNGEIMHYDGTFEDITERWRMEMALRESEANLQKAQRVANVGSWVWHIQANRLEWSEQMHRIFGIEKATFTGDLADVLARAIHPDDRPAVEESNRSVINDRKPIPLEYRVIWPDGTVRVVWAEAGELALDAAGAPLTLSGIVQDITERERTEAALRWTEERYRRLFDEAPLMDVVTRSQEDIPIITDCNQAFLRALGYNRGEVVGRPLADFYTPESRAALLDNSGYLRALEGRFASEERALVAHDGRVIQTMLTAVSEMDTEGHVIGTRAMYADITKRKAAEAALRESEERYRLLVENLNDIIYTLDLTGKFTYVSPVMERFSGYKVADLIGKPFADFVHPDDLPGLLESYGRTLRGEVEPFAYRIFDRDGSVRHIRTSSRLLYDDGGVVGITGLIADISDRVRAEAALAAEQTLLRTVVDNLPDSIYVKDIACRKTLANPANLRHVGATAEADVLGKTDFDLFPHDLATAFNAGDLHVLQTGQPILNREERINWPDGSRGWQLTSKVPLRDSAGQIIGLVGIGRDITERKQAEIQKEAALEALAEREAQYRGLFENATIAIFRTRPAGQTLEVNPEFARMFGYDSPEQVKLLVPDAAGVFADPPRRAAQVARLQAGENRLQITNLYRRRDGTLFTGHLSVRAERDATGAIRYLEGFIQDITDRERAAAEMAARAAQQAVIAELGQLALANTDLSTLLDQAVRHIAAVLDVELCKVLELLPDRSAVLLRAGVGWQAGLVGRATIDIGLNSQAGYTLQSRQPVIVADLQTEARFHGPALLLDHHAISGVSVIIGAIERPYGVLGIHATRRRDFTQQDIYFLQSIANLLADAIERKQAEDKLRATLTDLERSNADLQQFAYVASHDLQEPLRMVASYVQLLGMNYLGRLDADADEFIGYALEGAKRMQQLILDLLEYSRVGTRSAPLQPTAATLACQTALQDLEIAIAENHATVVCDPLPSVLADPSQLIQLFQNLIANAIKFHGAEPPHVHISARQTFEVSELAKVSLNARQTFEVSELAKVSLNARQTFEVSETSKVAAKVWEFAVRDNGIGIEPQYFERIFVIFQRLHTRDAYAGTGIGLAVCKRIVERHGGRIWIESTPGQGSTFYFTLPAAT